MENLVILVSLILLGYFFGQRAEKKHYQSILKRFIPPRRNSLLPLVLNLAVHNKMKKSTSLKAIL